jgi:16S rRNA (adenine1518-N6/adenine1519-N6)-dimethyltransferase
MTLSEMRQWLAAGDIHLTKSLGQNFLHDGNQLRRIAAAAELTPADRVLEVGPGLGPLTELLQAQAGEVLAIEKDGRLVEVLRQRFANQPRFRLLHEDALEHLKHHAGDWTGWKLVSNLPYSVASPILVELALAPQPPERMVATLQWEVVKRIQARAGDADYGILSLLLQLHFQPVGWFKIPASCFYPEPDVDSATIILAKRPTLLLPRSRQGIFVQVVKRAFSQRRKMMWKLLRTDWPEAGLAAAYLQAGVAREARAETVSLEQFAVMAQHVDGVGEVL